MKRALCMTVILTLLAGFIAIPAYAGGEVPVPPSAPAQSVRGGYSSEDDSPRSYPPGELMIFDALVLRPFGIVAMVAGFGGSIVTAPWAATSNSCDRVQKELFEKPYHYTFTRPLGDVD